jgi:hypothetical protein
MPTRSSRKRKQKKLGKVPIDDERFSVRAVGKLPVENLESLKKQISREIGSAHGEDRIRLGRQISWLDKRIRDMNFFRRLRELRGAPEDKEQRVLIFARAFFMEARKLVDGKTFGEICKTAELLVGFPDDEDPSQPE